MFGFKIIIQYEQGVVFRFGRALPGIRQPGLTWVNPFTDGFRKVNMQIVAAVMPAQEAITRDNVMLQVDAVVSTASSIRSRRHQRAGLHLRGVAGRPDLAAVGDRPEQHGQPEPAAATGLDAAAPPPVPGLAGPTVSAGLPASVGLTAPLKAAENTSHA